MWFWLHWILLNFCGIEVIDRNAFCGIPSLTELNLNQNKLTRAPNLTPVKDTLVILRLEYNNIERLIGKYFRGFRRLKHLFLSYNQLNTFPILPTRVRGSLIAWHLDGNQITSLDLRPFSWFRVLLELHLSHNKVRHFNTSIINKMPQLHALILEPPTISR